MKSKLSNRIQIALVIVFLCSLFVEMFSNVYYCYDVYYKISEMNFYDKALNDYADYGVIWGSIIIIACIVMFYMCIAANFKFKNKNSPKLFTFAEKLTVKGLFPITYLLPIVCVLCLGIYALILDGDKVHVSHIEYYYELVNSNISVPLTVLGAMISNCVFDFLNEKKHKQNTCSEQATDVTDMLSPAVNDTDELIKLKELLDMGIITQEEFDTKKTNSWFIKQKP